MTTLNQAIFAINPSIVTIRGDVAYDKDENEVSYDKSAAEAKLDELQGLVNEKSLRIEEVHKVYFSLDKLREEYTALGNTGNTKILEVTTEKNRKQPRI